MVVLPTEQRKGEDDSAEALCFILNFAAQDKQQHNHLSREGFAADRQADCYFTTTFAIITVTQGRRSTIASENITTY